MNKLLIVGLVFCLVGLLVASPTIALLIFGLASGSIFHPQPCYAPYCPSIINYTAIVGMVFMTIGIGLLVLNAKKNYLREHGYL